MAAVKGCGRDSLCHRRNSSLQEVLFPFPKVHMCLGLAEGSSTSPRLDPEFVLHTWKLFKPLLAAYWS